MNVRLTGPLLQRRAQRAGLFLTQLKRLERCVINMSEHGDPAEDIQGRFAGRDNFRLPFGGFDGDAQSAEHGLQICGGADRVERGQGNREA